MKHNIRWAAAHGAGIAAGAAAEHRTSREKEGAPVREFTILMPCLNEANALPFCIAEARASIEHMGLDAEILIADNGSTDGSPEIAAQNGARVVAVAQKGYGAALLGGIREAGANTSSWAMPTAAMIFPACLLL